ncbi:MAG: acyltransferase family protein [Pigmentiphaga sp.]|uniref:Acyltransferase n=1 Tax=Pigmentiphaga daeguensis TaxID=414049 RepID=A0ABN1BUQ9_9BURK
MQEIKGLNGLRGVAALMVFWAHLKETLITLNPGLEWHPLVERMFLSGGRQVDVFFVLSGFIMTLTYQSWFATRVSLREYLIFLRRRLARIYPLHLFMLLLVAAAALTAALAGLNVRNGLERFDLATLPQHLLLIHAWGPFMPGPGAWNPPSWSISVEWLAYLLFPFLLWLAFRIRRHRAAWALMITVALGISTNIIYAWSIIGPGAVTRGLTEFGLGCAVALCAEGSAAQWLASRRGSLLAAGLLLLTYGLVPDTGFIIALACSPLLLSLCGNNPVGRALGSPPLNFLGEISYSVYLGHFLFSSVGYRLVSPQWMASSHVHAVLGGLLLTAWVIALSTLTYRLIERPARIRFGGRSSRPTASAVLPSTAGKAP